VPIPLHCYDGALIGFISLKRSEKLFDAGRAKLVRHKTGTINRVILHPMPDEAAPMRVADYLGKHYSYQQHLDSGHRCWPLKSLSGDRSGTDLAPAELRPLFLSALRGCPEAA
jgi:hypothetical protein